MATPSDSKAYAYVLQKSWAHRVTEDHIILEVCPVCNDLNPAHAWKFYLRFSPKERDGMWDDKVCGEHGNLYQLMEFNGDRLNNITSMQDASAAGRVPGTLPNIDIAVRRLWDEAKKDETGETSLMDYLVGRGISIAVIEKYKLGLTTDFGRRWLTIPYYQKGNLVFAKFRSLPPGDREFRGISGREAPLFNSDCLRPDMEELIFTEGEMDCLSCLSNGIEDVVAVPGANLKKMAWIKKLDDLAPKVVYILYDRDKTGQDAAKEMAMRIGVDKVRNILLPEFTFTDAEGNEKPGKDINEWFRAGNGDQEFMQLKADAKFFAVDGVQSTGEIILEIRNDILTNGSLKPKWYSKWPSINKLIGGYDPGDLVGLMAEAKVGKTTMAMDELDFFNTEFNEPVMMFCQEMSPKHLVRKWISNVTDTPQDQVTIETVDGALTIAYGRKADYLFAYTRVKKREEVYDTIRQAVRRYGVKAVCFDNLQLLVRDIAHSAQETSVITKEFKALAMELSILTILIIQPNRVQEGQIIAARNASGSSAIEKDVDAMLCLHRERIGKVSGEEFAANGFLEVEGNFAPEILVRADLTRFAAGGSTTLKMLGDRSRVEEMSYQDRVQKSSLQPLNDQLDRQLEAA